MLTSIERKIIYDIKGISVPIETGYEIPFRIFSLADINISLSLADGSNPTLESGWSLSVPSNETGVSKVIFNPGYTFPANATKLVIERYVPPEQGVDFRNGDMFDAEVIEGSFDKLTAITQQLTEIASRSFKLPVSESPTDLVFPGPTERAGKIIGFGDDGNEVVMYSNFEGAVEASEEARKTLLQIIEIQGQIQTDKEEVTDLHAQMEGMLHPGLCVTVGNGTDTEFLIEHNLNTEWTNTQVWYSDPENEGVPYLIQELDKNRMKITFKSPPPVDGAEVRIISCDRVNVIDLLPDGFTLMPDQIAPDCALSSEEIASVIGTSIQNNLSKEN